MRRKTEKAEPDVLLASIKRMGKSFDRYSELYPSITGRIKTLWDSSDPALREKIRSVSGALATRDESTSFVQRYGLTPAQARLARYMAARGTLAGYAEKAGISTATARTHLKAIYAKTGASGQSELTRMLLSNLP